MLTIRLFQKKEDFFLPVWGAALGLLLDPLNSTAAPHDPPNKNGVSAAVRCEAKVKLKTFDGRHGWGLSGFLWWWASREQRPQHSYESQQETFLPLATSAGGTSGRALQAESILKALEGQTVRPKSRKVIRDKTVKLDEVSVKELRKRIEAAPYLCVAFIGGI